MQRAMWCVVVLSSCGVGVVQVDDGASTRGVEQAVSGTIVERSLVVTDAAVLARFPFSRTMDALRASMLEPGQALAADETSTAIFQRWMRSFARGSEGCNRRGIDPNGYGLVCPRAAEAKLASVDPLSASSLVRFVPVGLFNRFDLTPGNGETCGEHRIVYAMPSNAALAGRAFIIFEASLPNPTPSAGVDGCLPVAQFWQQLSTDADVNSRATKLERFFYEGTAVPGAVAVVRAQNYGFAKNALGARKERPGQVRTNFFVDFAEWNLREFKLRRACGAGGVDCRLFFDHVTVKANPAEELFSGTAARTADFLTALPAHVDTLVATDVNAITLGADVNFDEFESVSSQTRVLYRNFANAASRDVVRARLGQLGSTLSDTDVLNRATTQTCAGCHLQSDGQALGGGLVWPRSLGFTHISETGQLSSALVGTFLPHRLRVLERFITEREGQAFDPSRTLGGATLDSAN